jgi:hypothetical protein
MKGAVAAIPLVVLVLAAPAVRAEPSARMGAIGGLRIGVGGLGERYRAGYVYGVAASLQPWSPHDRVRLGLSWSLAYDTMYSSDDTNVDGFLNLMHLGMAARGTLRLPTRWVLLTTLELGGELLRSQLPVPPDGGGSFVMPTAALGIELVSGNLYAGLAAGWTLGGSGPQSASLLLTLGVGNR